MKCPVCGGELKEISNTQTRCESCGLIVRRVKKPVVVANAAELNEKIDRLEQDIGTSKSRNSIGKRLALKIILPTTLLLIVAAVTLMACLMGLRGVYVNDNDPNEFVSFSALNYEYYTTKDNVDKISIGTWSRKNNVLRINESGSNDAKTCDISFKNFNKLTINGKIFSRRNLLYFRDIIKNCTVTFDANGGDIGKVIETDFGARIDEPTVPKKDGYEFGGWYTTQWGSLNNYTEKFDCNNRIWEDVTYYANWNSTYSYKVFENNTNVTDVVEGNLLLAALKGVETTGKTYEYFIRERYGSGRDWQKITDATRMPNYDIEIKKGEESNRDLKVSFDLVGGTFDTQSLSAKYAENCKLPIAEPQKDGFYFDGWSYNNTKYRAGEILWVSPATRIVGDECTLVANWVELKPVVFDSNGGSGEMATKIYAKHNDTLRLPKCTYTKPDSVFIGWSETTDNENRDMVLAGCFYKLDNQPTDTITFTARWMPKNATYFRIDIAGRPQTNSTSGNHFMFGRYPQSVKEDNVQVSSVADGDGFYLGSDGERYKKVEKATPRNDVKFMNGKEVVANATYYFKLEPVLWWRMYEDSSSATLISDVVLDYLPFKDPKPRSLPNLSDWENSTMRSWLNSNDVGGFLREAFTPEQQAILSLSKLDNRTTASGGESNTFAMCQVDTEDKVYLPSYKDIKTKENGFNGLDDKIDKFKWKVATDYTRSLGVHSAENPDNGGWMLRSPLGANSIDAVRPEGTIFGGGGGNASEMYGIAPCLKIRL